MSTHRRQLHIAKIWAIIIIGLLLCLVPGLSYASGVRANQTTDISITSKDATTVEVSLEEDSSVQWQIYDPQSQKYIDIIGATSPKMLVNAALVDGMQSPVTDRANIRAAILDAQGQSITYSCYSVELTIIDSPQENQKAEFGAEHTSLTSALTTANSASNVTHTITVHYRNGDSHTSLADDTVHTFEEGTPINWDIYLRTSIGYAKSVTTESTSIVPNLPDDKSILNIKSETGITKDEEVSVIYDPQKAIYKLSQYVQNIKDDNYSLFTDSYHDAKVDEVVPTKGDLTPPAGFMTGSYEAATVTGNDKTSVSVEFDRYYYKAVFDWNGGIDGPSAVYGKFGQDMPEINPPGRAGCTFAGWYYTNDEGEEIGPVDIPSTIINEDRVYLAHWDIGERAKVSVVYWGENANDNDYSYLFTQEEMADVGSDFSKSSVDIKAYSCEHHDISCYAGNWQETTDPLDPFVAVEFQSLLNTYTVDTIEPENNAIPRDGYMYAYSTKKNSYSQEVFTYYIYVNNKWYSTSSIPACMDGDSLGKLELTESYPYHYYYLYKTKTKLCGHSHIATGDDRCHLFEGKYSFDHACGSSQTETSIKIKEDGSSVYNIYLKRNTYSWYFYNKNNKEKKLYSIENKKWGSYVYDEFVNACHAASQSAGWGNLDSVQWSYVNGSSSIYTGMLTHMNVCNPGGTNSVEYYFNSKTKNQDNFYYYIQKLDRVDPATGPISDNYVKQYTAAVDKPSSERYRASYTIEEFIPMTGFIKPVSGSNPAYSPKIGDKVYNGDIFYYKRASYQLAFNNGFGIVEDTMVQYEKPMREAKLDDGSLASSYVPERPPEVDSHYVFGGWYMNPQCSGEQYNFETRTMQADNLILYAKWQPISYDVNFFTEDGTKMEGQKVVYNNKYANPPANPEKEGYRFISWFYKDEAGIEHAFYPSEMTVLCNMDLYPKYASAVLKPYTVYYRIWDDERGCGTDTEIATPKHGQAYIGRQIELNAKTSLELRIGYKDTYIPKTAKHVMTISENEEENVYIFWYSMPVEGLKYTVHYKEKNTEQPLAEDKVVDDWHSATATEKYINIDNYLPVAPYTQTLVLYQDKINEITFYYETRKPGEAMYDINHWLVRLGQPNELYRASSAKGVIGEEYSATPISIEGYNFDEESSTTSGILPYEGLSLDLYYVADDNPYPYLIHYVDTEGNTILEDKSGTALVGTQFGPVEIPGWTPVNPSASMTVLPTTRIQDNTVIFVYYQKQVTINYKSEDENKGIVSRDSETLNAETDNAQGSTASHKDGYHFTHWTNEAGENVSSDIEFFPAKQEVTSIDGVTKLLNVADTYTAHFSNEPLTIELTKTVNNEKEVEATIGDEVSYKLVVTNTSDIALKNIHLRDNMLVGFEPEDFDLDSGAQKIFDDLPYKVEKDDYYRTDHKIINTATVNCTEQGYAISDSEFATVNVLRQLSFTAPVIFNYDVESVEKNEESQLTMTDKMEDQKFENRSLFDIKVDSFIIKSIEENCHGYESISNVPLTVMNPYELKIAPIVGSTAEKPGDYVPFAVNSDSGFKPAQWTMGFETNKFIYVKFKEAKMRLDNKEPWRERNKLQDVVWKVKFADED